jgi:hypothetical protein
MKGNPAVPGGSLTSKPTWLNTSGYSATSVFFALGGTLVAATSRAPVQGQVQMLREAF